MASDKSEKKSVPPGLKPFAKGGDPRQGRGPKKGAPNAGRPPDEFKRIMRALASRADVVRKLQAFLTGKDVDPEWFFRAFKETADRGYGKPAEALELSGPEGGPIPLESADELRERILRELAGIAARKRAPPAP